MITAYRGRFAPTPSGPLHLGSLLTALASYLEARHQGGRWLIRIDDLDTPRNVAGADGVILHQLEAHGLIWDETPRRQSEHLPEYQSALAQLSDQHRLYGCGCSRAELARSSLRGPDGPVYPGTCRHRSLALQDRALRVRTESLALHLDDPWQGPQRRELQSEIGDFVVRRSDGQIAYQLACVVDEARQDITEVIRGADLLGSTFRQMYLQRLLGLRTPGYRHLPVLTDAQQLKLSKQNHAAPLTAADAPHNLVRCLQWLGQAPPPDLSRADVAAIHGWAATHWNPLKVPRQSRLTVE